MPAVRHARIRRRANRADPLLDEDDFVGRDERRRTEIEQERPGGIEADARAELVARRACASREPLVVDHRAREDDVLRVGVVHGDRFGLLRLVPDEDLVGLDPDQPFVRQVVPAEDGKRRSDTEPCAALT